MCLRVRKNELGRIKHKHKQKTGKSIFWFLFIIQFTKKAKNIRTKNVNISKWSSIMKSSEAINIFIDDPSDYMFPSIKFLLIFLSFSNF